MPDTLSCSESRRSAAWRKLTPYVDSRGLISIGVGFNLHEPHVRAAVLAEFGVQNAGNDATYYAQLVSVLSGTYIGSVAQANALSDLDRIMAARIAGDQFDFVNSAPVKAVFDSLAPGYEAIVNQKTPGLAPYSAERIALFSIAYNTKNGNGLGKLLKDAVASGNRAEAWFEIRFNTNPTSSDQNGIARHRCYESQTFGLYDQGAAPTAEDARQVYAMLARHRGEILAYEAAFGTPPDSPTNQVGQLRIAAANNDYALTGSGNEVQTLWLALEPARNAFVTWINSTQLPAGETPLVASEWNPAAIAYNSPPSRSPSSMPDLWTAWARAWTAICWSGTTPPTT